MAWVEDDETINGIVSSLPEVRAAVREAAEEIATLAKADLLNHRNQGHAEIEVEQGDVDSEVFLVDAAAVSIEYGHFSDNGEIDAEVVYVPGLYIITRAAGLLD